MICLHGIEVGSIDFFVLVADCYRFSFLANTLKISNCPWMRSFLLAWGLGGKIARMRDLTRRVSRDNMPYDATMAWHLSMNDYITD